MEETREHCVYNAKMAEQAERYDEMAQQMNKAAKMDPALTLEERNLVSVAYKNTVGSRRASWRIISSIQHKQESKQNHANVEQAIQYRLKIEAELNSICNEILQLLDDYLIPAATTAESRVFYYKMKGDYYRYICEFMPENKKEGSMQKAAEAYEAAMEIAAELPPTHPIRLGLALNFSVFYYEIRNCPEKACAMAQNAFNDAVAELDHVSEESYRDSTMIMQLLRDNLTLWTADAANEAPPTGSDNKESAGGAAPNQPTTAAATANAAGSGARDDQNHNEQQP